MTFFKPEGKKIGDFSLFVKDNKLYCLFIEKTVLTDLNLGFQPKQIEFVIPPNSTVKIQATQSANNGNISCMLTGYKI